MNNDFLNSQEFEILRVSIDTAVKNSGSEKEEELKQIVQSLRESGYITDSYVENLQQELAQELYDAMMREMLSAYSEDDIKNLINAVQTGLDDNQMVELYLRLYSKNTGKDIELYAVEVIEGFIEMLINQFKIIQTTIDDVKDLTDDQAVIITNLIDEGFIDEAEERLAEFKNGGTTDTSSKATTELPKDDIQMLHQLLKNNYIEEAKQVLEKLLSKQ